jgi:hypothetical protein
VERGIDRDHHCDADHGGAPGLPATPRAYDWARPGARVIIRAMVRALFLIACLALAHRGAAAGGRTSKVTIETDPPGAKVYFGLKEDGEICTTPCTVDAPIGETPIIVEAENRRSIIENLIVPKRTAHPMRVSYKLEPAIGTLIVEGGTGATIKIDDEDRGKAPGHIEGIVAGAHHVVVEKNGKAIYDAFVEIEAGHEATVTPPAASPEPSSSAHPGNDEPAIATTSPAPARPSRGTPAITVAGTVDFGARQFTYSGNATRPTQRDNKESGQLLAGPIVELWPTTLLGLGFLPGLALYGRFEFGLNSQPVDVVSQTGMHTPTSLSTVWQSLEVSVHQRWTIASTGTIEVGAGYTEDRYQFKGDPAEIANVPDASYKAVRIGGRASLLFGPVEPYVALENRLVLSGGVMDTRYALGAEASGVHLALGAAVQVGHIQARLEGGYTRYSWTFKFDNGARAQAEGGTDVIENATLSLGYVY